MEQPWSRHPHAELAVRRLVLAAALRYRVNARPEHDWRRTADLLLTRVRVAVLMDGCYWHGCPEHFKMPSTNRDYWEGKIGRNGSATSTPRRCLENEGGWSCGSGREPEAAPDIASRIVEAVRRC